MLTVATSLLVLLEATLSPSDAVGLLGSTYPDSVSRAALAAVASQPGEIDKLFEANPRIAAELLSTGAELPKDAQARLQSAFLRHAELGGPEAAAALMPKAMAGLILRRDIVHGLGKSILHWALHRAKDDPVEAISELLAALLEMKARLSEEGERDLQEALARYLEDDGQRTLPLVESIIADHAGPAELARDADGVPEVGAINTNSWSMNHTRTQW